MKVSSSLRFALVASSLATLPASAIAQQHHPTGKASAHGQGAGAGTGQPHVNPHMPQLSPAQIRQMQQEEAAMQRQMEEMQRHYYAQQLEKARRKQQQAQEQQARRKAAANPTDSTGDVPTVATPKADPKAKAGQQAVTKATPKTPTRVPARPESVVTSRPTQQAIPLYDQAVINHLIFAHTKLAGADHDYQGHRVDAMHHVTQAVRHLNPTSSMGGSGVVPSGDPGSGMGGSGSSPNLAQSTSDAMLRDSLNRLEVAHRQLSGNSANGEHHARARVSVKEAIDQLHVALNVR